jgi:hypothetical protein
MHKNRVLCLLAAWFALMACQSVPDAKEPSETRRADCYLYLTPDIVDRAIFYHSFERGLAEPEINVIGATVQAPGRKLVEGLTGQGWRCPKREKGRDASLTVASGELSVHEPRSFMMWWRLDAPMSKRSGFHLIRLEGAGWISNFVHGAGKWCNLQRPTNILQVYRFSGISNHNGRWGGGPAMVEPGEWHHVAITISAASETRVFWDGRLVRGYHNKGRLFREGEVRRAVFGRLYGSHPMTVDEIVILDVTLDGAQLRRYVETVRRLREVGVPFVDQARDR